MFKKDQISEKIYLTDYISCINLTLKETRLPFAYTSKVRNFLSVALHVLHIFSVWEVNMLLKSRMNENKNIHGTWFLCYVMLYCAFCIVKEAESGR